MLCRLHDIYFHRVFLIPRQNVKLQNVKATKRQGYKTSRLQNVKLQNVKATKRQGIQNVKATKRQGIQNVNPEYKNLLNLKCRNTLGNLPTPFENSLPKWTSQAKDGLFPVKKALCLWIWISDIQILYSSPPEGLHTRPETKARLPCLHFGQQGDRADQSICQMKMHIEKERPELGNI